MLPALQHAAAELVKPHLDPQSSPLARFANPETKAIIVPGHGGITAILGANGAGKTTTLRAVCGMVKTGGIVRFEGSRIDGKATEDIVRLGIAHTPEGRGTFMNLTVEENLRLGGYARKDKAALAGDFDRIYQYFPVLAQRRRQQAGTLSGGEQQMLALGRAMMSEPHLICLDEPSLGLAPMVVQDIFRTIRAINTAGTSVLLVEQNARYALATRSPCA